jgi:hypothetical protein
VPGVVSGRGNPERVRYTSDTPPENVNVRTWKPPAKVYRIVAWARKRGVILIIFLFQLVSFQFRLAPGVCVFDVSP